MAVRATCTLYRYRSTSEGESQDEHAARMVALREETKRNIAESQKQRLRLYGLRLCLGDIP